jgi:hypothetical protein
MTVLTFLVEGAGQAKLEREAVRSLGECFAEFLLSFFGMAMSEQHLREVLPEGDVVWRESQRLAQRAQGIVRRRRVFGITHLHGKKT